jgi:fluoroacetyl-CoA thioesterase
MKNPFSLGDVKVFRHVVKEEDSARFESGEVHAVYSTFALARDAEWSGRLFILQMKDPDEEGVGTGITVSHHAPALIGSEVIFTATLVEVKGHEVITNYEARIGDKLIASGEQRQKILKKDKLKGLFK